MAMSAAGTVHRVSATTCLLFSIGMAWSLNKLSQEAHGQTPVVTAQTGKKKK